MAWKGLKNFLKFGKDLKNTAPTQAMDFAGEVISANLPSAKEFFWERPDENPKGGMNPLKIQGKSIDDLWNKWFKFLIMVVVALFLLGLLWAIFSGLFWLIGIKGVGGDSSTQLTYVVAGGINNLVNHHSVILSYTGNVLNLGLRFIFGIKFVKNSTVSDISLYGELISDSAIMIAIAVWVIFFVLIRDLIGLTAEFMRSANYVAFFFTVALANFGIGKIAFELVRGSIWLGFGVLVIAIVAIGFLHGLRNINHEELYRRKVARPKAFEGYLDILRGENGFKNLKAALGC